MLLICFSLVILLPSISLMEQCKHRKDALTSFVYRGFGSINVSAADLKLHRGASNRATDTARTACNRTEVRLLHLFRFHRISCVWPDDSPSPWLPSKKYNLKRFDCTLWKTAYCYTFGMHVGCPKWQTSAQRSRSRRFRSGWHDSNNTWYDEWTNEQRRSKQLTYRVVRRAIIYFCLLQDQNWVDANHYADTADERSTKVW